MSGGHSFTTALPSFSFIYSLGGQKNDNVVVWAPCSASLKHMIRNKYNPVIHVFLTALNTFDIYIKCSSGTIALLLFAHHSTEIWGYPSSVPGPPRQDYSVGWDLHLHWGCATAESEAIKLVANYPFEDLMTWCVNCLSYRSPRICKLAVCFWQEKLGV